MKNIALVEGVDGPTLSYAAMFDQVRKIAVQFPSNSVISSILDNSVENAIIFLSITASGSAIAPLNYNLTESEYEFFLKKSSGGLVVSERGTGAERCATRLGIPIFCAALDSNGSVDIHRIAPSVKKDAISAEPALPGEALILYTSGTTGTPKCVALTHRNLIASIENIVQTYALSPTDRTIAIMPLFHIHGLIASLFATLGSGGTVVFPGRFSATNFFKQAQQCTWFTAVPTMLHIILETLANTDHHVSMPHLRFIRSCSSSLAPSLLKKLEIKFHVQVLEAYAMTEAAHQMTSNPLGKRKAGTVGIPHGRVEISIFDLNGKIAKEGEICVRGPNVISAYKGQQVENQFYHDRNKSFFRTGDQGFFDTDGYLVVTGRIKELINRGGEKISPIEIDSALLSHPNIFEAVAFAMPDEKYGETVGAAVILRAGSAQTSGVEIANFLKTKLASFKVPTRIFFTTNMPKTETGKIQRRKVAQFFLNPSKM